MSVSSDRRRCNGWSYFGDYGSIYRGEILWCSCRVNDCNVSVLIPLVDAFAFIRFASNYNIVYDDTYVCNH